MNTKILNLKRKDLEELFKNDSEIIEIIELIDDEINLEVIVEYDDSVAIDLICGFSDGMGEIFETLLNIEDIAEFILVSERCGKNLSEPCF